MKRGSIAVSMAFVLAYMLAISSVSAGPGYKMTLESGAVYQSERVDDDTVNISNSSGEQVGSVTMLDDGGYEVFDAGAILSVRHRTSIPTR